MTSEGLEGPLATAELVGALTYGQLRAFQITAAAVRFAPTIALADRLSAFAILEHDRYRKLRDHLGGRTDLADRVVERQRPRFDEYFDGVRMDDWIEAVTFFAVGLPMAADFARAVARLVDDETAAVITSALADRADFEDFARAELLEALRGGADAVDRLRHLVADVDGRALTGFQAAMTDSDALQVLLAGDEGGAAVKQLAIEVLHTHRERMIGLGLDDVE